MSDENKKIIVGLDIGYSNTKITWGNFNELNSAKSKVLPSTFQAVNPYEITETFSSVKGAKFVKINGQDYVTCVGNPILLQDFDESRCLTEEYPFTDQYMALYLSALLEIDVPEIERLVIGLPVNQYSDLEIRAKLKERLTGEFHPTDKTTIVVKNVDVVPQPLGSFLSESVKKDKENLKESTLLVIDIGCYSTDWIVIENQHLLNNLSGTSIQATHNILERTRDKLALEYKINQEVSLLENYTRINKNTIKMSGIIGDVDYTPFLAIAQEEISKIGVTSIKKSISKKYNVISDILLIGGGAKYYYNSVKETFPDKVVHTSETSVLSNSNGFFIYASLMQSKSEN